MLYDESVLYINLAWDDDDDGDDDVLLHVTNVGVIGFCASRIFGYPIGPI